MRNATLFGLALIVLLGAATRLHDLDTRSLWEDEGWTLLLSVGNTSQIAQTMAYDQHPPLYFILIRPWITLTGESEFSLRFLSVLFGLIALAGMAQLGRVAFHARVGAMAAALFAVWDFPIDVSQDARQYSLLLCLVILSCVFFFRYLKSPSRFNGLGWWLVSVLALYTQYMAGVVLIFQLVYLLLWGGKARLDLILRWGLICLAFVPWLPVFIRQNEVRWDDPLFYQSGLPNNAATFRLMRDALVTQQFGVVIGLAVFGVVGVSYAPRFRVHLPTKAALMMLVWTVGYIGLIVWLNERQEILRLRIFILVVPPILLLMSQGLVNLQPVARAFLLIVLLAINLTTIDTRQNNPPWREVVGLITPLHQSEEAILMDNWVGDFSTRYYVRRQMGELTPWLSLRELARSAGDYTLPELADYLAGREGFWLIRWNDDPEDYDGLLADLGYQRTTSPYILHEGNNLYSHRYDRLSDARLATFGSTIDLLKVAVESSFQAGQPLTAQLWWVARDVPPHDYSVSLFVMDAEGNPIVGANQDGPPLSPTSTWQIGRIQFDSHEMTLPTLPAGSYQLGIRLYWYAAPAAPLQVLAESGASDYFAIHTFEIE